MARSRRRHGDLDQQLVRREHRAPHAGKEGGERSAALSAGTGDDGFRVEGEQRRRHVGRRCGITQVADHGGQISDLNRSYQRAALGD